MRAVNLNMRRLCQRLKSSGYEIGHGTARGLAHDWRQKAWWAVLDLNQ